MHPDPSDSGGAGLAGAPGERRPGPGGRGGPRGTRRRSWWVAAAALAAVCLLPAGRLVAGGGPGGAGPRARSCSGSAYLSCAAAAFLLGTVFSLVAGAREPPPDFAAAWRRLARRR